MVEWKRNLVAHGDAREEKWRGKRRMEWVAKESSVWLGTVHPVLLQKFSPDPHSKKASTRLNWHPRRYKWTLPFRWKTESGFWACANTFRFHSNFALGCGPGTDYPYIHILQCMLERTGAITNEVLEPIAFVLAYRTVLVLYVQLLVLRACDTKVHLFHL